MTSLVLGTVGAVAGFAIGGPAGAQLGFTIGSTLGSIIDRPDGPSPGDLSAPDIQEGHQLVRPYGTVLLTVHPVSVSDYTATANPTGGKGGPPEGSAGYTYTLNVLGVIAQRVPSMPLIAITRVWVNKKLVDSRLAASTPASLAASAATEAYTSITLYPGGSSQTPPPEYETRVGTANASAYRNVATVEIIGLNCGGSKTPPLVDVEVCTAATLAPAPVLLHVDFNAGGPTDLGCYSSGASSEGTHIQFDGSTMRVYSTPGVPTFGIQYWTGSHFAVDTTAPFTMQCRVTFDYFLSTGEGGSERNWLMRLRYNSNPDDDILVMGIHSAAIRVTARGPGGSAVSSGDLPFLGGHIAVEYDGSGVLWVSVNGIRLTAMGVALGAPNTVGAFFASGRASDLGYVDWRIDNLRLEANAVWSGANFEPPLTLPEIVCDIYTPGTADLKSIVDAELALNPAISLADHDTSDLAAVTVRGFKAAGPPGKTIAELGDIFYFDCVPSNPIKYVRRGAAVVGTIANVDTGVGVDEAGSPFSGLKIGNDVERPSVIGLSAPNASADHEPVFRRGDRLTTEGPDVQKVRTEVGLTPSEVQGRALAMSLMARASGHTAEYGLSDKYAAAEPGDAYYVYDDQGNLYNKIIRSLTYQDGVKNCKWELNDTSALVETGITDATYTPSLIVTAPVDSNLVAIDAPIMQDADDNAGHYTAIEGAGSEPYPGGVVRRSTDNLDFSSIATTHPTESVVGTSSTALANWTGGYVWDEFSSVTVTVGTGQTLSSSTHAAMQASPSINAAFLGAHGRWEVIRYRTATLVSTGKYTLTGLLRGVRGTEAHMGSHTASDTFVQITSAGLRRASGEVSEIGRVRYLKAVTDGRAAASATSESFTNQAVGLKPFSPTNLRASRDGSANITFTIDRRPRKFPRYGGAGGSSIPPAETGETYELDVYATSGYATVLRTLTSSTTSFSYTAAQQTTDFGSAQATVYTRSYTRSATVGRGHYLQASA